MQLGIFEFAGSSDILVSISTLKNHPNGRRRKIFASVKRECEPVDTRLLLCDHEDCKTCKSCDVGETENCYWMLFIPMFLTSFGLVYSFHRTTILIHFHTLFCGCRYDAHSSELLCMQIESVYIQACYEKYCKKVKEY